nr:uncharacterized protein LOC117993947 [Maniola hyperantus]
MLPTRSSMDCVGETSRFFPTLGLDGDSTTYTSPFQTPSANRYSSSTDSTSPESYFNTPIQIEPFEHNRPRFDTPKPESRLYDSQPIFHDSPMRIFESPNSTLSYSTFDRDVTSKQNCDTSLSLFEPQNSNQSEIYDTPLQLRRKRAILGRNVFGCHSKMPFNETLKSDTDSDIWQPTSSRLSETSESLYELFPSNESSYEWHTKTDHTINTSRTLSPTSVWSPSPNKIQYEDWSLTPSNLSPIPNRLQTLQPTPSSLQNLSPTANKIQILSPNIFDTIKKLNDSPYPEFKPPPYPEFKVPYNPILHAGASSSQDKSGQSKMCMFCRKNGETPYVYMNHRVKEKIGNKFVVSCPILRALVCSTCGATGDDAHTITYCPVLRSGNNGKPLQSTTITLKNTRIKSNGRKRH